jgi:hypothetical protein
MIVPFPGSSPPPTPFVPEFQSDPPFVWNKGKDNPPYVWHRVIFYHRTLRDFSKKSLNILPQYNFKKFTQ